MPRSQDFVTDKSDHRSAIDQFMPYIRTIHLNMRVTILHMRNIDGLLIDFFFQLEILSRTNEGRWNGRKKVTGGKKIVEREEIAWERACARITRERECVGMRVAGANRLGRVMERKGDDKEEEWNKRARGRERDR